MRLLAAIAFLSRFPIQRRFEAPDVARSAVFFPLVGAAIGVLQVGAVHLGNSILLLPATSLLLAALVLALSAWVTRGLHLDGLADFADGLGGGTRGDPDSVLRIMRDSHIGAFGVVTIVSVLLIKLAAIVALLEVGALYALIAATTLSRWTSVPASHWLSYARSDGGTASALTDLVGVKELLGATLIAMAIVVALTLDWRMSAVAWVACLVSSFAVFATAISRIGGITGDVLGAAVEISETSVLVGVAIAIAIGRGPC